MSRIEIIIGCMFSGKSSELIRRINTYKNICKKSVIINSHIDTRNKKGILTHSGDKVNAIKTRYLMDITNKLHDIEVIGVDESQFFDDLYKFSLWCERNGKVLVMAGLDGDTNRKSFGQILDCIPLCDTVVKLTALDKDGSEAIFTRKKISNFNLIEIGDSDIYEAVSREHYLNNDLVKRDFDEYEHTFDM
mgnify:CR=1 FL=1|tara:strand:- start:4835 stop:5407 length:573 start_codon:yes stop_codon:yes gene_type:complete